MTTRKNFWSGASIVLRTPTASDIDKIVADHERTDYDSEAEWLADELHLPRSAQGCRAHWEKEAQEPPKDDNCNLIIVNKEDGLCGFINVFNASPRHGGFSYGISLLPEYRGLGYAEEAVNIVLSYYFNQLRYHRCGIHIYDFNERSIRFHEKLGFTKVGQFRECHFFNGRYHDCLHYDMTAEEFNKNKLEERR